MSTDHPFNSGRIDSVGRLATRPDDDPRVTEEQARDEYSIHVVPPTARVSKWKIAGTWWLNASAIVFIYYGALAADIAGTRQAILGLILAAITMAVLTPHFIRMSAETGLGSSLVSRRIFGRRGATLTVGLIAVGTLFFTVIEGSILARALHIWFDSIDLNVWYAVVVIVGIPLALGGVQTWLSRVSNLLLPLYVVGIIAALVMAAMQSSGSMEWLAYEGSSEATTILPGWLKVYLMYMALWLLLVDQIDFARFGKVENIKFNSTVSFGWAFFSVTYVVNAVIGIYLSRIVTPDVPASEVGIVHALINTLGFVGLIAIIVSQVRINVLNMYMSSLNSSRVYSAVFNRRLPRFVAVFGVGTLAFLMMLTDVFSYIYIALDWLAILFVAWVGIYFTHLLITRYVYRSDRMRFRFSETVAVDLGIYSWVIAAVAGGLLIEVPGVPPVLAELSPLVTLALAVSAQSVLMLVKPRDLAPSEAARTLEAEIGDTWEARGQCSVCGLFYVAIELDARPGTAKYHCLACESKTTHVAPAYPH